MDVEKSARYIYALADHQAPVRAKQYAHTAYSSKGALDTHLLSLVYSRLWLLAGAHVSLALVIFFLGCLLFHFYQAIPAMHAVHNVMRICTAQSVAL